MLTIVDPIEHARMCHPERPAVVDGARMLSYGELHERCARLGAALRALGLVAGDRVAILANNSHRYLEVFMGVPAARFVVVPLNTRLASPELEAIVSDCGARVLLCDRDPGELAKCVEHVVHIPDDYEELLSAHDPQPLSGPFAPHEEALASLFYTGGTTGTPKGVMLTHRNLVANAFHKALACSLSAEDVFLAAPAMFHVAGIAPLLSLVWLGGRVVVMPSFDAEGCLDTIQRQRVSVFMPVPTMLSALVAAQERAPRDVSSLRMIGHAGSPIANQAIEAAHRAFPGSELAQFYGATETASIVTCLRHEERLIGSASLGTCGRAVPGTAVRVARDDGEPCGPGEIGEVLVRGPNVTKGYWGKPDESERVLAGGWYHTGDLGVLDGGAHLFLVDRKKDMIVSGGENVYSLEVEDVLYRHPAVLEAAVFGIPDEKWGEAVHAVVVVSQAARTGGSDLAAELAAHCRASIAGYKVPKRFDLQSEPLPKSGPGKILKRALRDPFWERAAGIGGVSPTRRI